jgi:pyruvate dehydrogenase (quinone)
MDPEERSSENDRRAHAAGSNRREFLGRTIRGGAFLAATTVLGNDIRSPEGQAESQTHNVLRDRSTVTGKTTADLLADKLVEWGVSMVFGIPGDKIAHILDAIRRRQDKIRFILVRHEEAAAFMASGHAKFSGKLGVCVSTAGPGAVHLLNGLYDAKFDGFPVLAITGSPPRALLGTRFTQGVDTISLYDDVTNGGYYQPVPPGQIEFSSPRCPGSVGAAHYQVLIFRLAKACCENGCYFFGLAGMRRSLFKAASSRKRFWS